MTFINESNLKFEDISSEAIRTYEWPSGVKVIIDEPLYLNVSKSGGHRIFDAYGISHYIPSGWNHLYWVAKDGQPHFVK